MAGHLRVKCEMIPHEVVSAAILEGYTPTRAWREYLKLTQGEVAARLGMHVSDPCATGLLRLTSEAEHKGTIMTTKFRFRFVIAGLLVAASVASCGRAGKQTSENHDSLDPEQSKLKFSQIATDYFNALVPQLRQGTDRIACYPEQSRQGVTNNTLTCQVWLDGNAKGVTVALSGDPVVDKLVASDYRFAVDATKRPAPVFIRVNEDNISVQAATDAELRIVDMAQRLAREQVTKTAQAKAEIEQNRQSWASGHNR